MKRFLKFRPQCLPINGRLHSAGECPLAKKSNNEGFELRIGASSYIGRDRKCTEILFKRPHTTTAKAAFHLKKKFPYSENFLIHKIPTEKVPQILFAF